MIVFVAGMPRAGSMLTYNIVRDLFVLKKYKVLPEKIPVNETDLISESLNSAPVHNNVYCIKTHHELKHPIQTDHDIKILCNIRDVRDACLSYKRFMHSDFETSLNATMGMMQTTDHYVNNFSDDLLQIRFEDLTSDTLTAVNNICDFLGLSLTEKKLIGIIDKYSRESVKQQLKKLSEVKVDQFGKIKGSKYKQQYDTVANFDGTYRTFDKNTSFQSNHITSKKDGEWKEYFSSDEIDRLNSLCRDWLKKYEYEL